MTGPLTVTVKALVDERTAGAIAKVAALEERAISHVVRTAILADPRIRKELNGRSP